MVLGGLGQSKRSTVSLQRGSNQPIWGPQSSSSQRIPQRTQDQNMQRTLERWALESSAMPLPRAMPTDKDRDDRLGYETREIARDRVDDETGLRLLDAPGPEPESFTG